MLELVIGGVRSGKSDFAENRLKMWLEQDSQQQAVYIATSVAIGEETKSRIARHQLHRDSKISTCELDYKEQDLQVYLEQYNKPGQLILIECLSTWVGWYLSQDKPLKACIADYESVKNKFISELSQLQAKVVIVTGEVGCGLIGESKLMRCYADKLGELNQQAAALADRVTLVTAGIAQTIKTDTQ
ncbi:bifunctional adenosylcobinamide kinase/adenosylcobinamide-phosphate guanylyltransferase [Psychromonas aquimarina]|uniref:bifunctional adenosylcobinamide kinase/adenosylcobinamide-phosphate guanylyltransferase n=1 Tax=Psychromonas aquimarina TaxID=444919 RepID=UPI0003F89575|nr:bifunctional adenosylcobinamide kinase/adenosylcobinamide-phosphate guanylyltransferase [Psychromonas aquimarina]